MPPSDTAFLIGTDLVEFDRRDLPIYATPESQWADAASERSLYGASLDRLFGEPHAVFVTGDLAAPTLASAPAAVIDDPLVEFGGINDGLMLPVMDHEPAHAHAALHLPDLTAIYDFADGLHLQDLWTFDSHT
jgi:hypothetical protein